MGFWLLVGLATGVQQAGVLRLEGRGDLAVPAVLQQLLSALPWIVLTPAIAWVVHRIPLRGPRPFRTVLVHGVAAVATAFVANILMVLLYRAFDSPFVADGPLVAEAVRGTLRWLHVVVLVYAGIAALAEWLLHGGKGAPTRVAPGPVRLTFQEGSGTLILEPEELDWLEADGDYVRLHVGGRDHLVNHRLGELADRLAPAGFVRIHRSTVVNRSRVRAVEPIGRGDRAVVLRDGTRLRLSRRRAAALERLVREGQDPAPEAAG